MRTLGNILKRFFWSNKKQYWLCIPSEMESKKAKDLFIMDTLEFLSNKITIK
jgi:hypothetical protein